MRRDEAGVLVGVHGARRRIARVRHGGRYWQRALPREWSANKLWVALDAATTPSAAFEGDHPLDLTLLIR